MDHISSLESDINNNNAQIASIEGQISREENRLSAADLTDAERQRIQTRISSLTQQKTTYEQATQNAKAEINLLQQARQQQDNKTQ